MKLLACGYYIIQTITAEFVNEMFWKTPQIRFWKIAWKYKFVCKNQTWLLLSLFVLQCHCSPVILSPIVIKHFSALTAAPNRLECCIDIILQASLIFVGKTEAVHNHVLHLGRLCLSVPWRMIAHSKPFTDNCQIVFLKISKCRWWIQHKMLYISKYIIFPGGFTGQRVLNKGTKIWLNGAWPANTCIWPSIPGCTPGQPGGNVIKILQ